VFRIALPQVSARTMEVDTPGQFIDSPAALS
jgi:hypothetical protein